MSEVKRRRGESFEGFMRRVKRQWQQSGRLLQIRKDQFFIQKKSKTVKREQAVVRVKKLAKREYLRKIGKLPEEEKDRRAGSWRRRPN